MSQPQKAYSCPLPNNQPSQKVGRQADLINTSPHPISFNMYNVVYVNLS